MYEGSRKEIQTLNESIGLNITFEEDDSIAITDKEIIIDSLDEKISLIFETGRGLKICKQLGEHLIEISIVTFYKDFKLMFLNKTKELKIKLNEFENSLTVDNLQKEDKALITKKIQLIIEEVESLEKDYEVVNAIKKICLRIDIYLNLFNHIQISKKIN